MAVVLVPVAAFGGFGAPGTAGGWTAAAVVNDQVTSLVIGFPARSVTAAFTVAVYVVPVASAVGVNVTVRVAALYDTVEGT